MTDPRDARRAHSMPFGAVALDDAGRLLFESDDGAAPDTRGRLPGWSAAWFLDDPGRA